MTMNEINKTLYIPLYGKALISKRGIILQDRSAEQIWEQEGFQLKGKSKSKWLALYMSMRASVFDRWLMGKMETHPDALILHIGCGLDGRISRVENQGHQWFDIDFPEVIDQRKKHFSETDLLCRVWTSYDHDDETIKEWKASFDSMYESFQKSRRM